MRAHPSPASGKTQPRSRLRHKLDRATLAAAGKEAGTEIERLQQDATDRADDAIVLEAASEQAAGCLETDLEALCAATRIDGYLKHFVQEVLEWVRIDGALDDISHTLENRERELKLERAYLLNAKRRADWRKDVAMPLDYRWPVVREMIIRVGAVK
jgi:hypothetical protein